MTTRGQRRHLVTLANPTPTPNSDGGFDDVWTPLSPPTRKAEIKPATARDLERTVAGTVQSSATHIVTMDYHPGVTTKTRLTFNGRQFSVTGVQNIEERNVEMALTCEELVL